MNRADQRFHWLCTIAFKLVLVIACVAVLRFMLGMTTWDLVWAAVVLWVVVLR